MTSNSSKIDGNDSKFANYSSVEEMIQREVSGVRVINGEINIHDSGNMYVYVSPLVLIDGVPGSLSIIRPSMVESIEVIKERAAAI